MAAVVLDLTREYGYDDDDLPRLQQVLFVLAESLSERYMGEGKREAFLKQAKQDGRLPEDWRELYCWHVFVRLYGSESDS